MHLLARFSKVVLGLALLSWPVIGYSLRMSNADWVDPIFKPTRIAADVNNCGPQTHNPKEFGELANSVAKPVPSPELASIVLFLPAHSKW